MTYEKLVAEGEQVNRELEELLANRPICLDKLVELCVRSRILNDKQHLYISNIANFKEVKMKNPNADNECRARIIKALSKSVEELSLSAHAKSDIDTTIETILERIRFLAKEIK